MKTMHKALIAGAVLLLGASGAAVYQQLSTPGLNRAELARNGVVLLQQPRKIPPVTLADHQGQSFDATLLKGKWTLVFFGYTFCPDICPTTLAELRDLMQRLPEPAQRNSQVVMISVDPARDTPERLHEYLNYFNPAFIGMTGELSEVQKLSDTLGVPFIPGDTSRPNYTVDHSGNLAIIDPNGDLHGFVRAPLDVARLAQSLPVLLEQKPGE